MAAECPGKRSRPAGKLSSLVGIAESLSPSVPAAAERSSRSPTPRSPRSFDYDGAVGLGIVAAMNDGGRPKGVAAPVTRKPRSAPPLRSVPIPIVSAAAAAQAAVLKEWRGEEQKTELSESYTCVISHVGGVAVRKRVYFDDGAEHYCWSGCPAVLWETPPAHVRPSLLPPPPAEGFLSQCFRCRKKLHGIDIFMYRGDKAFCSVECRCQQMLSEETGEKRAPSKALKPPPSDCSAASPCSTPLFFAAGVAAA